MHIEQAKILANALRNAIAASEAAASTEVDLTHALQAADDAARADLQAAIDAASKKD